MEDKYGEKEIGKVKAVRGKIHHYLGMILDCSTPGKVHVDMKYYVKKMVKEFEEELKGKPPVLQPANENIFKVNEKSPNLDAE